MRIPLRYPASVAGAFRPQRPDRAALTWGPFGVARHSLRPALCDCDGSEGIASIPHYLSPNPHPGNTTPLHRR